MELFGLSLHDLAEGRSWFVDLRGCGLDPAFDKGLTGLCREGDLLYLCVQSTVGGKVIVLDSSLEHQLTLCLEQAEDLHSLAIHEGALYLVSTRNSSLVKYDLASGEESLYWQHEKYIHLNDVKFHEGECYILSQDSPFTETNTGGTVTRLKDRKTIITGLDQPHSLWFEGNTLTVLSSRRGEVIRIGLNTLQEQSLPQLPGYARGIWQTSGALYVATSSERFHSRKQGPEQVYVDNFDDYLGNPEFQSNLYLMEHDGNLLDCLPLSPLNFEVYDLLALEDRPMASSLMDDPGTLKAQFYRQALYAGQTAGTGPDVALTPKVDGVPLIGAVTDGDAVPLEPALATPVSQSWWRQLKWQWRYRAYRDHRDRFVRGAWYFSDGWPLNFWSNIDMKKARRELGDIKALGFNSIFIVIPWRAFQPDPHRADISRVYLKRARSLLKLCGRLRLRVYARISYGHAICDESSGEPDERVEALLTESAVQEHWLSYLSALNSLNKYPALVGFFLCWEDYWHTFSAFQQRGPEERQKLAVGAGYQAWLEAHCELGAYNDTANDDDPFYSAFEEAEIPVSGSPREVYYLQFRNARIRQLFNRALDYISPLSMEVRVDMDGYLDPQGQQRWFLNDNYGQLQHPTLIYWAPFMGAENRGETLSDDAALKGLASVLERHSASLPGQLPLLNQFNFIERTPEFQGVHASIDERQMSSFLEKSTMLIQQQTSGYAIWALRNYFQNMLHNASFALGAQGWDCEGSCGFRTMGSEPVARLAPGAAISQTFVPRLRGMGWIHLADTLSISVDFATPGTKALEIDLSGHDTIEVSEEGATLTAKLELVQPTKARFPITLTVRNCGETCAIARVCLYNYEFDSDLWDAWGQATDHADGVIRLNRRLRDWRRLSFTNRRVIS